MLTRRNELRRGSVSPAGLLPAVIGLTLGVMLLAGCSNGGPTAASDPEATARDTVMLLFRDEQTAPDELVLFGVSDTGVHRLRSRVLSSLPQPTNDQLFVLAGAVDPQGREVFVRLGKDSVAALRVSDLGTVWSEPAAAILARNETEADFSRPGGGTRLLLLGIGGADRWLFFQGFGGEDPDDVGILAVERDTRTARRFLGGFRFVHRPRLASVGDCGGPDGRLILGGPRDADNARLMIYDARSLELLDSIFVADPFLPEANVRNLDAVFDARDCRHVFAVTNDSIFKVDVREVEVVARTLRRRPGLFPLGSVTTDPVRLWLFPLRSLDFCGDGKVLVYDGDLRDLGMLDLLSIPPPETFTENARCPPDGQGFVNREGDRLYLAVGGAPISFTLGAFEAHLWAIDPRAMRVEEILFVGGFGLRNFGAAF